MPVVPTVADPIWYLERGSSVPLVMVHGAGGTVRQWGYQLSGLQDLAHTMALDLPGHGRSPGQPPSTIAEAAERVLQWLDALGLPQAVFVGHSMGGAIVQWLALNVPERVLGIVLIGTGARLRVAPAILVGLTEAFTATTLLITRRAYHPAAPAAVIAQAVAELRKVPPSILAADYAACNAWDQTARTAEIKAPTLILVGEQDSLTPLKYSQWLHAQIAGSHLTVISAAGHMVMVEQADAVNKTVGAWISTNIEWKNEWGRL